MLLQDEPWHATENNIPFKNTLVKKYQQIYCVKRTEIGE